MTGGLSEPCVSSCALRRAVLFPVIPVAGLVSQPMQGPVHRSRTLVDVIKIVNYDLTVGGINLPKAILTASFVRQSVCPVNARRVDYFDENLPGFMLEVRSSGGKTFYQRYRDSRGRYRPSPNSYANPICHLPRAQNAVGEQTRPSFDSISYQSLGVFLWIKYHHNTSQI
jgi:hypothetical protein